MTRGHTRGIVALCLIAVGSCSAAPTPRDILVRAHDYSFEAPDSLPAGLFAFGLENAGLVAHELIVTSLKPGVTLAEVLGRDRADSTWRHLRYPTNGILTADSGVTTPGRLLITLEAGRTYLLGCGFQDTDTSAVHLHMGMAKVLRVY